LKRSNRLILLIGVFLAALAFVFVVVLLGGNTNPDGTPTGSAAPPTELDTVIAAKDIPLGVTVTAAMVTSQKIVIADRETGALGNVTQAIGKVARQTITKGLQVTSFQFSDSGAASNIEVPAGFTAIAVQVDQLSGVGTLIKKGDYVDVVAQVSPSFPLNYFVGNATTPISGTTGAVYDPTSVKMLIQGVQVVGTLLPTPPPATETGAATPAPTGGTTLNGQQEIVIVAVTSQQAEVIKFAQLDGNISLTLRSPRDFVDPTTGDPIVPPVTNTTGMTLFVMIRDHGVLAPTFIVVPEPQAP
jgi:pilus assembly protein CpaB